MNYDLYKRKQNQYMRDIREAKGCYKGSLTLIAKSCPKWLITYLNRRSREADNILLLVSQNATVPEDNIQETATLSDQYQSVFNTTSSMHGRIRPHH